jgi:hypothetical protein
LELAYGWFTTCQKCHKSCDWLVQSPKWLPTRLLDIGLAGDRWRLHITAEDAAHSFDYLTLSYRWGSADFIKLTESSVTEFRAGKLISDLPRTFRDAISVARRFSIRYLWIDSLCIVQDSIEDWQEQSALMRDVFTNSVCNVAAADSHGPDEGLFRNRDPSLLMSLELQAELENRNASILIWDNNILSQELSEAPLYKRGWVFQERHLPPRLLHFGKHQVLWQCQELHASENFPQGMPRKQHHIHLETLGNIPSPPKAKTYAMPQSAFDLWVQIVSGYTKCELTYARDKLVALSGLVHLFHERTGDEYLAGLWRSRFCELLNWRVVSRAWKPQRIRPAYRAPSWSWASIDGQIEYPVFGDKQLATIEDINILPLAHDTAGQIADGHVIVKGLLFQAKLSPCRNSKMSDSYIHMQIGNSTCCLGFAQSASMRNLFFDLGPGSVERNMLVNLLPLISSVDDWHSYSIYRASICGLILEQVPGEEVYRRFGFFDFTGLQAYHYQCMSLAQVEECRLSRNVMSSTFKIV